MEPVELATTVEDSKLKVPEDFSFPFTAYEIQKDFMKALFVALDERKLGIFESPTGTGKSLTLLCGSLTWLEKREEQRFKDLRIAIESFNLNEEESRAKLAEDWVKAQHQLRKRKEFVLKATRELKFLEDLRDKRKKVLQKRQQLRFSLKNKSGQGRTLPKTKDQDAKASPNPDDLTDLLLNDEFAPEMFSDTEYSDDDGEEEPEFYPFRVIFASRTHSQLSQFAKELKRTSLAARITTVSLGSRQNLCINSDVTRLKNLSLMNEKCLDLQKGSSGKKTAENKKMKGCTGCPHFNQQGIEALKYHILSEPLDIEELVTVAKKDYNACPYYASRKASKEAQLVLLPYNTILHSGTRDGIGLKTKNSVVLLDEAHNIIESISNMYSTHVTLNQLEESGKGLKTYIARYMSRFSSKNLLQLKQIAFIIKSLVLYLAKLEPKSSRVFNVREFKSEVGIEEMDLYSLVKYITKSKLVFKLKGYIQLHEKHAALEAATANKRVSEISEESAQPIRKSSPGQAILNFTEFLKSVTASGADGRIIQDGQVLKFLLLNASQHFSQIVSSARSIILAGGTMKPYEDIEDQLFESERHRITNFSCSHVIPDENLVCIALCSGPSSTRFDFTYKNRNSPQLMDELSRTILNISKVVPGGVVIFLPSYEYENLFYTHLKSSGVLTKIEVKKKVFREPKDTSCDKVLSDYSRQIRNSSGGLLFAVVGGKLSEGINFGDDLGRCVIVVGLPYPNITSVEIKEKINFISTKFGPQKAKQLLPNACFKAVNQSIGRSIRHANDYAAIILVDTRFSSQDSQAQLPDWILKKYMVSNTFGQCIGALGKFFASKSKPTQALA